MNRKDLTEHVCELADSTEADAVVLLENTASGNHTLRALRKNVSTQFSMTSASPTCRFQCFCRDRTLDMSEVHSAERVSVRNLRINSKRLLLALVHGHDIRNYDRESRQSSAQEIATALNLVKEQQDTNRIVLMGDFNMNPYDRGMNLAAGFNAMMTKSCVKRGTRQSLGKKYEFYYNPMWSLFGDNTEGPAGTVYDTSSQGPYGWSMLDQVLISHSIVDMFHNVTILTQAGSHTLMKPNGRPDSRNASDHFPILLKLHRET